MGKQQLSEESGRKYSSALRDEQARQTRLTVLEAAKSLFIERGYTGASIRAIAAAAGVSESTVYGAFSDKETILWAVIEHAVSGSAEPSDLATSPLIDAIRAKPDALGRLRVIAHWSTQTYERGIGEIEAVITEAARSSARLREVAEQIAAERYRSIRMLGELVLETLPPISTATFDRITQAIWAVDSAPVYRMLVQEQGWSPQEFQAWLFRFYCSQVPGFVPDSPQ